MELVHPSVGKGAAAACWTEGRTIDTCCRHDVAARSCWDHDGSTVVGPAYDECCPNADCWASGYEPKDCCGDDFGPNGNSDCWAGPFNYRLCCLAEGQLSWTQELFSPVPYDALYTIESFYTDAQYGLDFGYYSTGRVLKNGKLNKTHGNNFAHFTTFPMAMSPHFARLVCRMLLLSWLALGSPRIMRAVELGAGSGQLGVDVTRCIKNNELGIADGGPLRAWQHAMRYVIVERSPALAARQRSLGLRVVQADAQAPSACPDLREKFRKLLARRLTADDELRGIDGPGVMFSNELIDAFAPAKLRLSVDPAPDPLDCDVWQEVRVVHLAQPEELYKIHEMLGISNGFGETRVAELKTVGEELACAAVETTSIGRAALNALRKDSTCDSPHARMYQVLESEKHCLPAGANCISVFLALGSLSAELDLHMPVAAHDLRRRLRFDSKLRGRLRRIIEERTGPAAPLGTILLTANSYRVLRRLARIHAAAELELVKRLHTWKLSTPVDTSRCGQLKVWAKRHQERLRVQAHLFNQLGYSSMDVLVRFGEEGFAELANCLFPAGGFVFTVDYGANFEALVHSSAVSGEDNVVPPMYEIPEGSEMPDCHSEWTRCAGLIDWTTFIDFSNLAESGRELGWVPVYYGPQSALEQITPFELLSRGKRITVPGYFSLRAAGFPATRSMKGRTLASWYGNAVEGGQRWASFKLLIQFKKPIPNGHVTGSSTGPLCDQGQTYCHSPLMRAIQSGNLVLAPQFPLEVGNIDPCWSIDATQIPLADQVRMEMAAGRPPWNVVGQVQSNQGLLERIDRMYTNNYEDLQLATRLVDWMVATYGCHHLCGSGAAAWPLNMSQIERWSMWTRVWNRHRLMRVGAVIAAELTAVAHGYPAAAKTKRPFECAARSTIHMLCGGHTEGNR